MNNRCDGFLKSVLCQSLTSRCSFFYYPVFTTPFLWCLFRQALFSFCFCFFFSSNSLFFFCFWNYSRRLCFNNLWGVCFNRLRFFTGTSRRGLYCFLSFYGFRFGF